MTAARRNIYIDDDINEQIEIMVADSGGRHGELRYVFNSLLRDSPKMKKLLKPVDAPIHTSTKAGIPATVKPKFVKPNIDDVACYMLSWALLLVEAKAKALLIIGTRKNGSAARSL